MKKGGIYVLGNVVIIPDNNLRAIGSKMVQLRHLWLDFIQQSRIKAFHETTVASSARQGYQNLILTSGIGGMKPNTVLIPFYSDDARALDLEAEQEAVNEPGFGVAIPTQSSVRLDPKSKKKTPKKSKIGRHSSARHIHTERVLKAGKDIARLTSSVSAATPTTIDELKEESDSEALGKVHVLLFLARRSCCDRIIYFKVEIYCVFVLVFCFVICDLLFVLR